jgi:hypothetical protein
MEKTNFLYFRQVADMADDGSAGDVDGPGSVMYPASSFRYMNPTADGTISLYFDNMRVDPTTAGPQSDTVSLTVTQGKEKEAMQDIMAAVNSNPTDGFVVMADDCVTTDSATTALNDNARNSSYCSSHVTAVSAINVHNADHGYGVHEYSEVVDLALDVADDAVAGNLSVYIPAQAHITYAAITPVELAGNDIGSIALEVHSAHDTGASGGTEIVGADVAGNVSLPDADLDISSNAVVGKSITMGTLAEVQRSTAASYFALVGKADMTSTPMTGAPKVAVYLKWFGPAAVSRTGTA